MELRHLRYFLAAAEEEHFGDAAERLRITQPSLSRQIADLEAEIGVPLFDRLRRGVRLNPAGRSLLEDARRILGDVEQASERARRAGRGEAGTLDVGFIDSVSWHGIVPDSFRRFRTARPEVLLRLFAMSSREQLAAVRDSRLDVGFVYFRPPEDPVTTARAVATDHVMLAVPADHALAGAADVWLPDLARESFVFFPRAVSPVYFDKLTAACAERGFRPRVVQEAGSETAMLGVVASGLAVAFVNSAVRWRRPENVVLLPIEDLDLPLVLECVWRRQSDSPTLAAFLDAIDGRPEP